MTHAGRFRGCRRQPVAAREVGAAVDQEQGIDAGAGRGQQAWVGEIAKGVVHAVTEQGARLARIPNQNPRPRATREQPVHHARSDVSGGARHERKNRTFVL